MRRISWSIFGLLLAFSLTAMVIRGQAPASIQVFMPDGSLPGQPIRFTLLAWDDSPKVSACLQKIEDISNFLNPTSFRQGVVLQPLIGETKLGERLNLQIAEWQH